MAVKKKRRRGDYNTLKNRGWYCMHRGWQEHPAFDNEPFTKREAWEWLISAAVYLHGGKLESVVGRSILIMRGQLTYSYRFMAEAWGWDDSKVDRYLKKLRGWEMIEIDTEMGQAIITICNYDEYQIGYGLCETENEAEPREKRSTTKTNNKKDNKGNTVKELTTSGSALRADAHASPLVGTRPKEKWKQELLDRLGVPVYSSWIESLTYENGYVYAPNQFIADRCKQEYQSEIEAVLQSDGKSLYGFRSRD